MGLFDFLKPGVEFNNLAKSMNGMNFLLKELIPKLEHSIDDTEFSADILLLAYISRKGIMDRMEQYKWPLTSKIVVPSIDRGRITLLYAYTQTVGRLYIIANELGLSESVQEIIDRGESYYTLESSLPYHIKEKI